MILITVYGGVNMEDDTGVISDAEVFRYESDVVPQAGEVLTFWGDKEEMRSYLVLRVRHGIHKVFDTMPKQTTAELFCKKVGEDGSA